MEVTLTIHLSREHALELIAQAEQAAMSEEDWATEVVMQALDHGAVIAEDARNTPGIRTFIRMDRLS